MSWRFMLSQKEGWLVHLLIALAKKLMVVAIADDPVIATFFYALF